MTNRIGPLQRPDIPEVVTPLVWTYQPEQEVDIAIDVTSFCGSDGNSVDPFGNEFEIYIDAPMLKIDENRLAANKLNGTKLKAVLRFRDVSFIQWRLTGRPNVTMVQMQSKT